MMNDFFERYAVEVSKAMYDLRKWHRHSRSDDVIADLVDENRRLCRQRRPSRWRNAFPTLSAVRAGSEFVPTGGHPENGPSAHVRIYPAPEVNARTVSRELWKLNCLLKKKECAE